MRDFLEFAGTDYTPQNQVHHTYIISVVFTASDEVERNAYSCMLQRLDSARFYTVSYTYTDEQKKIQATPMTSSSSYGTQNQVAARSCWFESGQGHQSPLLLRGMKRK